MNSPQAKIDALLRARLSEVDRDTHLLVEIVPLQNRWRGLLEHLRRAPATGVEYNVIDLTSISATLPRWMIEALAERQDIVALRLAEEDR